MKEVYIISGCRTPIGKTGGKLKEFPPEKLAAHVLNESIQAQNLKASAVDKVYLGNSVGPGGNLARLSVLEAGWSYSIPATTIDFQCGSGLKTINLAAAEIASGQKDLIIAGGTESTSLEPRKQLHQNDPRFSCETKFLQRGIFSPESIGDPDMGITAENLAQVDDISRKKMDQWALKSHQRAYQAQQNNLLKDIIAPLKTEEKIISNDEGIRANLKLKLLERLQPAFKEDGKITAGNACLTHDGAAVIILASKEAITKYNLTPVAKFITGVEVGVNPHYAPLGAVVAIKKLLKQQDLSTTEIDCFEINEAFAVKIITALEKLNLAEAKLNIFGGALAYGHPYAASGTIILLHLITALKYQQTNLGIATLGVAGGQGIATLIERCDQNYY